MTSTIAISTPRPERPDVIRAGFIPLLDAAPLIAAARAGFAAAEGVTLELARETSWATLRDRFAVRHLDVAHMLSPMPMAANLGLTPLPVRTIVPITLGGGGNTITVSLPLWLELEAAGATPDFDALSAGRALARVVVERKTQERPLLTIAVVHPHSAHRYQLAYWLAACGVRPETDIEMVVIPPALMPAALAGGQIDAFTAGEPWGSVASAEGAGHILTTSVHIWRNTPEKVLGVREAWADAHPQELARLVRAVFKAAQWCDDPANRERLAEILSASDILALPQRTIYRSLERSLPTASGERRPVPALLNFASGAATKPWQEQALFLYAQMVRWGDASWSEANLASVHGTYRPELYDTVDSVAGDLAPFGAGVFFDGAAFDPEDIEEYVAAFARSPA